MRHYIITNILESNGGLHYSDGLNIDPYGPDENGYPSRLFFFSEPQLFNWYLYFSDQYYIRRVEIPKDAKLCEERDTFFNDEGGISHYSESYFTNTDKLFLYPKEKFYPENLENYIDFSNPEICEQTIKINPTAIRYIKNVSTNKHK